MKREYREETDSKQENEEEADEEIKLQIYKIITKEKKQNKL